jgi:hypothetical protein
MDSCNPIYLFVDGECVSEVPASLGYMASNCYLIFEVSPSCKEVRFGSIILLNLTIYTTKRIREDLSCLRAITNLRNKFEEDSSEMSFCLVFLYCVL